MVAPATRADAMRIKTPSEVRHLRAVGTVPGVVPVAVAGRCGPGAARIRSTGAETLQFRSPQSGWGPPVDCSVQGTYLLEAADPNEWLRVDVYPSYLRPGREARILLADTYGNVVGDDDVTASEAAAGDTTYFSLFLYNDSTVVLSHVRVWLDVLSAEWLGSAADGFGRHLSLANNPAGPWYSPSDEADGVVIVLADILPGEYGTLYCKRIMSVGVVAEARVLNHLHFSYFGL